MEIKCPKCGSAQIHANKKGFSTKKAVVGTLLAGPVVGAIAGTHKSNKITITCLACGAEFTPGASQPSDSVLDRLSVEAKEDYLKHNSVANTEPAKTFVYYICSKCKTPSGYATDYQDCKCRKCGKDFTDSEICSKLEFRQAGKINGSSLGVIKIILFISVAGLILFILIKCA